MGARIRGSARYTSSNAAVDGSKENRIGVPAIACGYVRISNDAFAGFNVMAIVVELPATLVVGNAQKFGMWATTFAESGSLTNDLAIEALTVPAGDEAMDHLRRASR